MTATADRIQTAASSFGDGVTKYLQGWLEGAGAYLCRIDRVGTPGEYVRIADGLHVTLKHATRTERNRDRTRLYELCEPMAASLATDILANIPAGDGRLTIATVCLPVFCVPQGELISQTITTRPQIVTRTTFRFSYEHDAYEMTTDVLYGIVRE